jgi:hypothetical protein
VKIPVVLITRKVGHSLLTELQDTSKVVSVAILRESSTDCAVPDYQSPNVQTTAASAAVDTTPASPQATSPIAETPDEKPGFFGVLFGKPSTEKFHLTRKMKNLLYEGSTKQPAVMCQHMDRIREIFDLIDKYEKTIGRAVNNSRVKDKVTKACGLLKTCMEKNYEVDFPYHCLTVLRLRLHAAWHDLDAVVSYRDSCVSRLRTLTAHSMETVFVPFLENKLTIPWSGEENNSVELLLRFFEAVYEHQLSDRNCRSIEDFGTSLVIAELILAVQQSLGKPDQATHVWHQLIKTLNPDKLLWSQDLLSEMKTKIDLGSSMNLRLSVRFDCNILVNFMEKYHLLSLEKIKHTIVTLYPSLPVKAKSWQIMAGATRGYLDSIIHEKTPNLILYSSAGDLMGFVRESRELIVTIFHLQNYTSVHYKPVGTSSDEVKSKSLHPFKDVDSKNEIAKWIELIIMSPFPGIAHHHWAEHVVMLRQNTPKPLSDLINKKVIELVGSNVEKVNPLSFLDIISKLWFIPKEIVGEFFRCYKAKHTDSLKDPVWQKLFSMVLEREWDSLKPDILVLLKALGQVDQSHYTAINFIIDMLTLAQPQNCPLLLSGEENQLLNSFKDFLLNLLKKMKSSLQGKLQLVLNVLGVPGESPMRDAVLDVYSQVLVISA